jgi:hypothetical protein
MKLFQPFEFLTTEECQFVLEQVGELSHGRTLGGNPQGVRKNKVHWWSPPEIWSDRLWDIAEPYHEQFQLTWMSKPCQISLYEPGDFYDWHVDSYDTIGRKSMRGLTFTMSLQGAKDAVIEFESGPVELSTGQGVFFPSDQRHSAWNRGTQSRWALTIWYMFPVNK